MSARHAVVVLAAGGSKRLGQPKQLLVRDGEHLVHRAVRLTLKTLPAQVLVITGARADAIAESVADLRCQCVFNESWQDGLASSLRIAGKRLSADVDSVLMLACDQPALEFHHLQAMLLGAHAASSGCAATRHEGSLGIPAIVPRAWFEDVPSTGDRGFGSRLRQVDIEGIHVLNAPELLLDIDDNDDLARARELGLIDG